MIKGYLKISQLAQKAGVLSSTIHFYTQEGLLQAKAFSQGGYRLYEEKSALAKIRQIQKLQSQKRLTIAELKKYFS